MSNNGKQKSIFFIAGEQSGDLHGSLVIKHLKTIAPEIEICGIGGPLMQEAGMKCLHSSDELAVIGFVEVLKNITRLFKILSDVKKWLEEKRPDMVVLIDYPGFNQRVASIAKALKIHVLYYICPQVWAWHAGRVKKLSSIIDEAVVVFPFEVDIWQKAGTKVHFFGHPLIGFVKPSNNLETLKSKLRQNASAVISLLPGSRSQEIYYILPVLLDAAEIMLKKQPDIRFLLPIAGTIPDSLIQQSISDRNLPITTLRGQTYDAIASSDMCLVASGTATLESAIIGTPMVIVYKLNWLTSLISKYVIDAAHIGLPNVIAEKRIVPEFIRADFTPKVIAEGVLSLLNDPKKLQNMRADLKTVCEKLGKEGASRRVAMHIAATIEERHEK